MDLTPRQAVNLNALALYAIALVLLAAFYEQIANGELPCPLCMLQRIAFAALAVGPVLAVRDRPRPRYYGMVIIAALLGAAISGRQVMLHIMPGDAGFGAPVLGLHYYSWAFLIFAAALAAAAVMLLLDGQFREDVRLPGSSGILASAAVWLVIALTALNAVSVVLQCGFAACAADPVRYELLGGAPRAALPRPA